MKTTLKALMMMIRLSAFESEREILPPQSSLKRRCSNHFCRQIFEGSSTIKYKARGLGVRKDKVDATTTVRLASDKPAKLAWALIYNSLVSAKVLGLK